MRLFTNTTSTPAYKITRTLVGVRCDVCNKIVEANWHDRTSKYYKVTTGHYDWGLESPESIRTIDVCPDCINRFAVDYLNDGSTSAYINIETERLYPRESNKFLDQLPKDGEIVEEDYDIYW